jgi:hypothetical protein
MPAFVRKSPETDKKRKALRSANPRKLEEQTLFKSINRSATKYPSLPGVEGARLDPRAKPARCTSPEKQAIGKNAGGTQDQAPKSQDRCLVYAAVYRLYGLTELEIGIEEGGLIRTG